MLHHPLKHSDLQVWLHWEKLHILLTVQLAGTFTLFYVTHAEYFKCPWTLGTQCKLKLVGLSLFMTPMPINYREKYNFPAEGNKARLKTDSS